MDRSVARRMLHRPSLQLAPIPTHPDLPDAGRRMLSRGLLVETARISGCVVGVAHDELTEDVEAVDHVFASQFLLLLFAVECVEGRLS